MSDIDKRISEKMGWWSPDGTDWHPERTAEVKQLIRDVLEEVKPTKANDNGINYVSGEVWSEGFNDGFTSALEDMEAKIKELGL